MDTIPPLRAAAPARSRPGSRRGVWLTLGGLGLVIGLFLLSKYTSFIDLKALEAVVEGFRSEWWGGPALVLTFCICAFIGVPQFALIGFAVAAFGALEGAALAWGATLVSGALTFWLGRFFGQGLLSRLGEGRLKRFSGFVARNAFAASAIVRNVPAGPFLIVNMVFGAVRAKFWHYLAGMAVGILPKIAVVAFGMEAIRSALGGQLVVAALTALAALAVFLGGYFYVRHRQRKGENIALSSD